MKKILMSLFLVHSILKSCEYNQNFNQEFQEQEQNYYPQEYQQQIYVQPQYFLQSQYSQQQVQQYPMQAQQQSYQQYPVYIQPQYDQYEPQYYSEQLQYPIVIQPQFYQEKQVDMQYQEQLRQQQHQEQFYLQQQNFTPELLVNPVAMQLQDSSKSFKLNPQAQPFYSNQVSVEKKLEPLNNVDVVSQESQFVNQPTDNDFTQNENERPLEVVSHDKTLLLKNLIFSKPVFVDQPIQDIIIDNINMKSEIDDQQEDLTFNADQENQKIEESISVDQSEPKIDSNKEIETVSSQLAAANLNDEMKISKTKKRRSKKKIIKKDHDLEYLNSQIKKSEIVSNNLITLDSSINLIEHNQDESAEFALLTNEMEKRFCLPSESIESIDFKKEDLYSELDKISERVSRIFIEKDFMPDRGDFKQFMLNYLNIILGDIQFYGDKFFLAEELIDLAYYYNRDFINDKKSFINNKNGLSLEAILNSDIIIQDFKGRSHDVTDGQFEYIDENCKKIMDDIEILYSNFLRSFVLNYNRVEKLSDANREKTITEQVMRYVIKKNLNLEPISSLDLEPIVKNCLDFIPEGIYKSLIALRIIEKGLGCCLLGLDKSHVFSQQELFEILDMNQSIKCITDLEMKSILSLFKGFLTAVIKTTK